MQRLVYKLRDKWTRKKDLRKLRQPRLQQNQRQQPNASVASSRILYWAISLRTTSMCFQYEHLGRNAWQYSALHRCGFEDQVEETGVGSSGSVIRWSKRGWLQWSVLIVSNDEIWARPFPNPPWLVCKTKIEVHSCHCLSLEIWKKKHYSLAADVVR